MVTRDGVAFARKSEMPRSRGSLRSLRRTEQHYADTILALRKYPMRVLPVPDALKLKSMPKHEDVASKLVEWKPGMGAVAFISHTWLSYSHPDPSGIKWETLRQLLQRAVDGQLYIEPHLLAQLYHGSRLQISAHEMQTKFSSGYIWIDYACMPQDDFQEQERAVASLHVYVADAAFFIVLAGAWMHTDDGSVRDFRAWLGRGYCRLEQMANALSPLGSKPLILAETASCVCSHGPGGIVGRGWLNAPVGLGDFTFPEDRKRLGPVLAQMISWREKASLSRGGADEMLWYRVLRALGPHLLQGTGYELHPREGSLKEWLRAMHFSSATDGADTGLTPLLFAVLAERHDFVDALVAAGADVNAGLRRGQPQFDLCSKGTTPLHLACWLHSDPKMVKLLLSHGANPRSQVSLGNTPLQSAMQGPRSEAIIDTLLEYDRSLFFTRNRMGMLPFSAALVYGMNENLEHTLSKYPELIRPLIKQSRFGGRRGLSLCVCASFHLGDARTLQLLIDGSVNVNEIGSFAYSLKCQWLSRACELAVWARSHPPPVAFFVACVGMNAGLHAAAYMGKVNAVAELLNAGADVSQRTRKYKMTPLHMAALRGNLEVVRRLLSAHACVYARDIYRRRPLDWAERNGHMDVHELLQTLTVDKCPPTTSRAQAPTTERKRSSLSVKRPNRV